MTSLRTVIFVARVLSDNLDKARRRASVAEEEVLLTTRKLQQTSIELNHFKDRSHFLERSRHLGYIYDSQLLTRQERLETSKHWSADSQEGTREAPPGRNAASLAEFKERAPIELGALRTYRDTASWRQAASNPSNRDLLLSDNYKEIAPNGRYRKIAPNENYGQIAPLNGFRENIVLGTQGRGLPRASSKENGSPSEREKERRTLPQIDQRRWVEDEAEGGKRKRKPVEYQNGSWK